MSIVNAWQNIEKKDEEEKKVVGQQQKTQSDSNKPTGTTSIPKNNQSLNGRTQNQSTSSSLRTENNITTASGTPKREESKQNVVRRNTVTANKQEQSQNQSQNRQRGSQRRQQTNTQQAHTGSGGNYIDNNRGNNRGGSSGTWGYSPEVDAARSRYASDLKQKHSAMNLLDDIDSLPDAKETKQNRKQLDDYLQSARKQYQYDTAFNDVTYQNAEGKTKQTPLDLLQNVAGSSGAGAMSLLGDIAGIGDFVKQKTSNARNEYRGFEPNRAYEQAMNAKDLNADFMDPYNAYKDYVADKYAKGEATNEELQNMVNLEMKYMNDPLRQVQMWGNDARASKQGYQEANPIASFAGDLVNMYVGNNIARGAANVLGAGKMLAPIATQGKTGLEYLGAQLANGGAEALMTDLPVQRVPELLRNINEGKSAGETAKDLGVGLLGDAAFNGAFNVLGDALGSLIKNKKAIPEVEDAVKAVDTPDVAEQIVKNADVAIPDEQILRNATDINYQNPIENIMPDVPKVTNKTVGDNELGALRDDAINRLAKQGGGDGALEGAYTKLVNDLYDNDVDKALNSIQEYRNTIGDNPVLNRTLQRMEDAVNGRIADGITPENYGYISNNIDAISDGLDRIRNLDGLSELGNTHLNKAYDLLAQYEDAVRNGGDAGTISKELNKTLGNLDNQAKKVNGYDGVFSEWKGANTARGDLYSNTGRIQDVNRPATPEEQSMIDEWIDYSNQNRYATPANQIPKADNVIPDAGATPKTDVPKNDISEAGVKAPKTDNKIPDLEEAPKYDRGPEGLLVNDGTKRERGYARSTRNNTDIPDEVAADFVDNPEIHNVLHNKDTKEKAQAILDQGFDKAYADYKDLLNKKDPAAVPLGYDLAKQMIDNGDSSGAADLIRDMSKSLTESGQFSQAAAITLMRNDPMTALRYAEKEIDALNADGAKKFKDWTDFKLTDDEIKAFNELEPGDKEGIAKLFDQIGARLGKDYPTTMMEKLLEARRIGMLFNIRTNVRNFGANVPTLGMRWASDRVDAVGQNIAHIINPDFKVTQSLTGSGKEGRKLATEAFNSDKVQALLKNTDGKYDDSIKGSLVKEKQMYKGAPIDRWIDKMTGGGLQKLNEKAFGKKGVQSIPETIRNATYKALELGDSPFVKENFVERLGSYIKAQGYKSIDEIPDEAIETAWEAAMKATYKDKSWAYMMIRDIKNGIGQAGKPGKVVSESLIPFVQAPGNIAARMVDYSPIGGANGIKNIFRGVKSGSEKTVREGINQLAQGATGSLALGIGVALHNAGIITGGYSQDKDKKAHEKNNGYREYALHVGDKYYTIDWAQPAFQTIMSGVLLADAINKSDQYDSDLLNYFGVKGSTAGKVIGASKEAAKTTVNAWFNASPLQSMQDLLGGTYEDASDIASKLWSVAGENFGGSYIPASVNAIAKTMDTTQRQTYDPSSKTASFVNAQIAKIPGLSKNLPAKYNTWGEEVKTANSTEEAAFNRFVNPGEGTTENKKPIDKELDRLFDTTGNNAVFPQVAPNKVNGEPLTAKQVSELQKDMGEQSYKAATAFMDSDVYKSMTDEQKAEGYNDLYTTAKWAAQLKLTDPELYKQMQEGDEEALSTITGNGASMKKTYITEGIDAVLDNMEKDRVFKETGAPSTDKAKEIYESEGEEGLAEYAKYYNAAKEASGSDTVTNASVVEALKDESPEVQKEMMDKLIPNQAEAAKKANESYANGAYKYYKYKSEADTDGNGRISADESHAYFDALDIPGTEKAYFDKAIRNNAKTSIYDGTAKKGTNKSTAKTSTAKTTAQPTGNNTFDALMKSKQKAREDAKANSNEIPDVGGGSWELSNGYNLKHTQTYQRAQAAGVSDNDFLNAWNAADTDGNGYMKKAEAQAYVNALPKDEQSKWFNILYKSNRKGKKKK